MKIVYCISGTYNSGGMERVLANKLNYLARLGHELIVITTDQAGREPYFEIDSSIRQHDLGINYSDNQNSPLLKKIVSYSKKQNIHFKRLNKLLSKLKADIVVSMFDHDVSFVHKIQDGSKKVLEIHFSRFKRLQYNRKGLWKIIDQYRSRQDLEIAKKYDAFVVLTEEDKGYWGNLINLFVIPNMNSFVAKSQAALENKRVIAVGRYDHQKNFDELIQSWVEVCQSHPDWELFIYGRGPLKKELENLIRNLNLTEVVKLKEPVKDIESEYLKSSILVMTSRYEGLPMALLEAQSCGLPLVSYACKCGPKDIIQNGQNGYLIEMGDKGTLAKRIIQIIDDSNLRIQLGDTSYRLSSNFLEEIIMKKWLNLFDSLFHNLK